MVYAASLHQRLHDILQFAIMIERQRVGSAEVFPFKLLLFRLEYTIIYMNREYISRKVAPEGLP